MKTSLDRQLDAVVDERAGNETGATAAFVEQLCSAARAARSRYEDHWRKAYRRLAGFLEDDLLESERASIGAEESATAVQERAVSVLNMTFKNFMGFLGMHLEAIRGIEVVAATHEDEDIRAAKAAQELLTSFMLDENSPYHDEILRALASMYCTGHGDLLIEAACEDTVPEDKRDVRIKSITAFDVYAYPGCRALKQSPAVVVREFVTRNEWESRWGALPECAQPALWPSESGFSSIEPSIEEGVYEVLRLFVAPCVRFPRGAQRVIAGNKLVYSYKDQDGEDWIATADNDYPIERLTDLPTGPTGFCMSRMKLSGSAQRLVDVAWSKICDVIDRSPADVMLVPQGRGPSLDEWTNMSVQIVPLPPGGQRPERVGMPSLEPLFNTIAFAGEKMRELTSQFQPVIGAPMGTRTPVGTVRALQQAAVMPEQPLEERIRAWIGRVGRRILLEGQRVWLEERLYLTLGKHQQYERKSFASAQLRQNFDVRVRPDDGLPKNRAERWQLVTQGLQYGLWANTPDAERARRVLSTNVDTDALAANQADEQLARKHFDAIKAGETVLANIFDNHLVHMATERYLAAQFASAGGVIDPDFERRLVMHYDSHVKGLAHDTQLQAAASGRAPFPAPLAMTMGPQGPGAPSEPGMPPEPQHEQLAQAMAGVPQGEVPA